MTAHAAQGQTLPAAIIDLQLGRGVSVIASYVALTRVRCREDLLIYRPFEHDIFTQGPPEGPELLLRQDVAQLPRRQNRHVLHFTSRVTHADLVH